MCIHTRSMCDVSSARCFLPDNLFKTFFSAKNPERTLAMRFRIFLHRTGRCLSKLRDISIRSVPTFPFLQSVTEYRTRGQIAHHGAERKRGGSGLHGQGNNTWRKFKSYVVLFYAKDLICFSKLNSSTRVGDYVDLPMIAVMGDTSSGKSSLLSSISMIELPSASTLTTRCPIELQMKYAPKKSAKVSIQWKTKDANEKEVSFPDESINERNWAKLPILISKAQEHIISVTKKQVASDVVCVEILGPHCEDLILVDLPGIVRMAGRGESEKLGGDIKALIDLYLTNSRCVVLLLSQQMLTFITPRSCTTQNKLTQRRNVPFLSSLSLT
jgi:hypothetical protein